MLQFQSGPAIAIDDRGRVVGNVYGNSMAEIGYNGQQMLGNALQNRQLNGGPTTAQEWALAQQRGTQAAQSQRNALLSQALGLYGGGGTQYIGPRSSTPGMAYTGGNGMNRVGGGYWQNPFASQQAQAHAAYGSGAYGTSGADWASGKITPGGFYQDPQTLQWSQAGGGGGSNAGGFAANADLHSDYTKQLREQLANAGMTTADEERIINKGTDEIAEQERNALRQGRMAAGSRGGGLEGGAYEAFVNKNAADYGNARAGLARDVRMQGSQDRNNRRAQAIQMAGDFLGRVADRDAAREERMMQAQRDDYWKQMNFDQANRQMQSSLLQGMAGQIQAPDYGAAIAQAGKGQAWSMPVGGGVERNNPTTSAVWDFKTPTFLGKMPWAT